MMLKFSNLGEGDPEYCGGREGKCKMFLLRSDSQSRFNIVTSERLKARGSDIAE